MVGMLSQMATQISNLTASQDEKDGKINFLFLNGDLLFIYKKLDRVIERFINLSLIS